jgi:hypothetical protein
MDAIVGEKTMMYPDLEGERDTAILGKSYRTFLLRCWQEETNGAPAWRFTLVQVGDKKSKRGFASLEDLTAYLHSTLAARTRSPGLTDFIEGEPK